VISNRILILDDEESYARMLQEILQDAGFETVLSTRASDALAKLEEESFALVVVDYKMPEMNGAEFLREARRALPDLPVIMVSGFMNTPELLRVANIGVTLVLEKPINPKVFLRAVTRFVAQPVQENAALLDETDAAAVESDVDEYPRPLRFLYDACPVSRGWIELFWEAHQHARHLPIVYPAGGCWNAATQEAACWSEGDPRGVLRLVASHVSVETALRLLSHALKAEEPRLTIVAIELGAGSEAWLEAWAQKLPEVVPEGSPLRFLYGAHQAEHVALPAALGSRGSLITIPPLHERLGDLATMLQRLLRFHGIAKQFRLTPTAIRLLLHYAWPGNEAELAAVARSLAVTLEEGDVTEHAVVHALEKAHALIDPSLAHYDMSWYLQQREVAYQASLRG